MNKEKARKILRQIGDSARKKITKAGGEAWSSVATYENRVTMFIHIVCTGENQTELVEFTQE